MIDKKLLERNMRSFMYAHPRKRNKVARFLAAIAVMAVVGAVPLSSALIQSHDASDGGGQSAEVLANPHVDPKLVTGYVYEQAGGFASGVTVTVSMINNGTPVDTQTAPFLTGADGFYGVTFDKEKWGFTWTIRIEATRATETGINMTTCDAEFSQYLNATLGVDIPEFSSYVPVVGGVLFVAVLTAISSRRTRKTP